MRGTRKNTAKATVDVPDVGSVRFEADQGPKNPWNMILGVSSALHRHCELFAEYGFSPGDLTFFAGGLASDSEAAAGRGKPGRGDESRGHMA